MASLRKSTHRKYLSSYLADCNMTLGTEIHTIDFNEQKKAKKPLLSLKSQKFTKPTTRDRNTKIDEVK